MRTSKVNNNEQKLDKQHTHNKSISTCLLYKSFKCFNSDAHSRKFTCCPQHQAVAKYDSRKRQRKEFTDNCHGQRERHQNLPCNGEEDF